MWDTLTIVDHTNEKSPKRGSEKKLSESIVEFMIEQCVWLSNHHKRHEEMCGIFCFSSSLSSCSGSDGLSAEMESCKTSVNWFLPSPRTDSPVVTSGKGHDRIKILDQSSFDNNNNVSRLLALSTLYSLFAFSSKRCQSKNPGDPVLGQATCC